MFKQYGALLIEKETAYQIMYTILALVNLIPAGMTNGYSAIVLHYLDNAKDIKLNIDEQRLFVSLPSIAMLIGCLMSIYVLTFGRRIAISAACMTSVLGWTLVASSYNVPQLLTGRVISGLGIGLSSVPGVAYVSEITSVKLAPILNSCSSLFISLGVLLIYLKGYIIGGNWRLVAACSVIVSVICTILIIIFLPESPRWLLIKGQKKKAKESLLRLRGLKIETPKFQEEFTEMLAYSEAKYIKSAKNEKNKVSPNEIEAPKLVSLDKRQQTTKSNEAKEKKPFLDNLWKNIKLLVSILKVPEVWKPFVILNSFFFFQQFCGIYIITAYAVEVISISGVTQNPSQVAVILGILQICGELGQILSGTKLGRRQAAIISGVGMTVSLASLGVYNQLFLSSKLSGIPLACILTFVALGTFGFVNLPWSMIGELYPTKYVHVLGPVTTCMCGLFSFSSLYLYPTLRMFGPVTFIYFYSIVSFAATIFVIFALTETVGKSKKEIEEQYARKK